MTLFEERYKKLNDEQKRAVDTIEGPVMIVAGPGSGKTEVLGLRVANILRKEDVSPANILCLTFTDAAAFNMRKRLVGLLGNAAYRVAIHTFHSFGVEIINRYPEYFYSGASFVPADTVTQIEILEEIFKGLEHGNPLRGEHKGKFINLHKVLRAIEYLKKAGLTPDDFKKILAENKKEITAIDSLVQSVFRDRVSKKMFPSARKLVKDIKKKKSGSLPGSFTSFAVQFTESLTSALDDADAEGKTGPLTKWKGKYIAKGDSHIADLANAEKFEALANIYEAYTRQMHEEGYYDFNDMILDVIKVLADSPSVRYELQERYQYILVDEFQDTNDAQMRLLSFMTDHPVHEGRPNVMVVGDDDQAVFKFQGAEISNIRDFEQRYRKPALIVLKKNYRSTQLILDIARRIILQGGNRLEKTIPVLKKELVAVNDLKGGSIKGKEFLSRDAQYQWIASEVKRLKDKKVPAKEIVVIAREHKELEALVPYFHSAHIPLSYEREENVLREHHILQLVTMARFVDSIMKKLPDADDLLPEILSFPFWEVGRPAVWELSLKASRERKPWMMIMRESGGKLKEIADFFIELGAKARYATSEEILHELIGGPQLVLPDENSEDETMARHDMFSPFRSYYFGKERFNNHRAEYLRFLSSLQSFVQSLREYHRGKPVTTSDMIAFVDMHTKNNLAIHNVSQFMNSEEAVQFMTAHKAKGLEFDAVFVINCENDVWADEGNNRDFPLPANLPISPASDNRDDQLRLFYVAITRAKRLLYFTSGQMDYRGKPVNKLGFLAPSEGEKEWFESEVVDMREGDVAPEELLIEQWNSRHIGPFTPDEKALLQPALEKYQLSVTHLQNFLNVADAGPSVFLEKNLLRFPEPKTPSSAFGTAVHNTIRRIYQHLKSTQKMPLVNNVVAWFKEFLEDERLNKNDFNRMLKRGQKAFAVFYKEKKGSFSTRDISEFSFKDQGVVIGEASLAGKIDRMSISENEIIVCDFKTSKAMETWSPGEFYEKIRAWKYRQQLIFYKLLIEGSRDFAGKYAVSKGVIEFVEPYRGRIIDLPLDITEEEVARLRALIEIVYKKIQALDFPDISKYSKDVKGISAFENDLLQGKI